MVDDIADTNHDHVQDQDQEENQDEDVKILQLSSPLNHNEYDDKVGDVNDDQDIWDQIFKNGLNDNQDNSDSIIDQLLIKFQNNEPTSSRDEYKQDIEPEGHFDEDGKFISYTDDIYLLGNSPVGFFDDYGEFVRPEDSELEGQ